MNQQQTRHRLTKWQVDWPLIFFFVLAYAIAWGTFGIAALIARQSGLDSARTLMSMGDSFQFEGVKLSVPYWLVYLLARLADFSFSISGIIMIGVTLGRVGYRGLWQRLRHWRIGWRWYLAGLLPVFMYTGAAAVASGLSSADFSAGAISKALFSLQAGFFVSLFLRGAMGEELGLRGFALPRLQAGMTPFRASLIIGVLWGFWHFPVLIGRDGLTIAAFCLLTFGLSFLFTWMFNGSGGSLIPVLLFHAAQNWEEGFETLFPNLVGTDWELLSTLALLILGAIAGVLVWRSGKTGSAFQTVASPSGRGGVTLGETRD